MTNTSGSTSSNGLASQAGPAAQLRIIRMPASKPWRRPKRPPPQVFRVDRAGFRQLVQSLTGALPMNAPPSHPSAPVMAPQPSPGPPMAISYRLQGYVEEAGRRFGEEYQYVWPSPEDPAAVDWIDTTTARLGRFQQPVANNDIPQSYVEEEGRRFGEGHQNVWPSPADPASGDWIDMTTARFGRFQQPVAINDIPQSYVEEEGRRFGEEHQNVWHSPADPAAGGWLFQGR